MDFFLAFVETTDSSISTPTTTTPAACILVNEPTIAASPIITSSPVPSKQEKEKPTPHKYTLPTRTKNPHTPFTAPWVVARLRDSPDRAVGILKSWSHDKHLREANDQTILEINRLEEKEAVEAVEDLKKPRVFVRGTRGSKLSLATTIVTLDTRSEHKATTLLDSGCEGSCVDVKYVEKHGLNTISLPRPIPVYNADGQPNSEGPITDIVTLELRIGEHWE